jgi:hypoxanthine phosphoribosyltransferase
MQSPEQQATHEHDNAVTSFAGELLVRGIAVESEYNYRLFTNPNERMEYMHFTDDLITTLDGTAEKLEKPYDAVVYLDSSARPVQWMVSGLWEFAAKRDENGQTVAKPQTYFVNIDARRTGHKLNEERTAALHDTFTQLAAWDSEEQPKKVLIVDEIAVSGDTLEVARENLQAAYPNLDFNTFAWKNERGVPEMQRDNVRWYVRKDDKLRLVLDGTELSDKQSAALVERGVAVSGGWLAVPNPDREGPLQVREEVDQMVQAVISGDMPYWPSNNRDIDEIEELVAEHNDGLTMKQFKDFREWMKRYYSPSPIANLITRDDNGPLTEREANRYLNERQRKASPPKLDVATAGFIMRHGYA